MSRIQSNEPSRASWEGEKKNATACVPISGPLRKLIGPAKGRLLKYSEEVNVTLARAFEEKDCDEEDICIHELIIRIKTTCTILERCNSDWASQLKDFKGEERAKEEEALQRFTKGDEGYLEVLLDTNEMVSRLQSRQRRIKEVQDWRREHQREGD